MPDLDGDGQGDSIIEVNSSGGGGNGKSKGWLSVHEYTGVPFDAHVPALQGGVIALSVFAGGLGFMGLIGIMQARGMAPALRFVLGPLCAGLLAGGIAGLLFTVDQRRYLWTKIGILWAQYQRWVKAEQQRQRELTVRNWLDAQRQERERREALQDAAPSLANGGKAQPVAVAKGAINGRTPEWEQRQKRLRRFRFFAWRVFINGEPMTFRHWQSEKLADGDKVSETELQTWKEWLLSMRFVKRDGDYVTAPWSVVDTWKGRAGFDAVMEAWGNQHPSEPQFAEDMQQGEPEELDDELPSDE